MAAVYISGHRNPDMDSINAAYAYAALKNDFNDGNDYRAVRCGRAPASTKALFKQLKIPLPPLVNDISPRVIDITRRDITTLEESEPVLRVIKDLDEKNLSVIPILNEKQEFTGVVSLHEISHFLISENLGSRPTYRFHISNFAKVVPGYYYMRGEPASFIAPLMTGAMPYEVSLKRLKKLEPTKPVLVIGHRKRLLEFAVEAQLPAIIITGLEKNSSMEVDFSSFKGTVYVSHADTAETIRLLRLSMPVGHIMTKDPPHLEGSCGFDTAKQFLLGGSLRGLPVMEQGRFMGIVTRRCFIEKPRKKLILVDHNELAQSIPGADQAHLLEIIDHHRIDTTKTREPIYIYARPLGSTCTIVYLHYKMAGFTPSPEAAALMLGGLVADTLDLHSPTSTEEDRRVADALEKLSPLSREEIIQLIFSHSKSLKRGNPRTFILSDFKTYKEQGYSVGIGQVEVISLDEVEQVKKNYFTALEGVRRKEGLDWAMLLVTDVAHQNSVLFTTGFTEVEKFFLYESREPRLFDLPGVLSRKKQLFPEVYRALEELANSQ